MDVAPVMRLARHRPPVVRLSAAGRNPALDGLRGIAVAAVVYRHLGLPGLYGGGVGVFAFFTLSGFIITFLLCAELAHTGRVRLGAFWARRARRLLPALLLAVVLATGLAAGRGVGTGTSLRQALPALGYFANWWRIWESDHPHALQLGPLDHTWSLSIEEQFYLTWPLLFLLLRRLLGHRLLPVAVLTLLLAELSAATRYLLWDSSRAVHSANLVYNRTDSEAELLLIGAAAGVLVWHLLQHLASLARLPGWVLPGAGSAGLLVLGAAFRWQPSPAYPNRMHAFWTGGLTVIAVAVAALCMHVMLNPDSVIARLLGWPPLPQLGRISYGIYLYHYPFVYYLLPRFTDRVLGCLVVAASTLAMSTLSWWLMERPVINWGRRRSPAPARLKPGAPGALRLPGQDESAREPD